MTNEEVEEIRLRFMLGQKVSDQERRNLLQAFEGDEGARSEILEDARFDGLLRALGRGDSDTDDFVRRFQAHFKAEGDATSFIRKVETRIEAAAPQRRSTRRSARTAPSNYLLPALLAAGVLFGIVLLFAASSPGPAPSDPAKAQREARRRKAEETRVRAEQARKEAEKRLATLLVEERQAAEAKRAREPAQGEDLRKRADDEFAEILRKRKEQEEMIARLRDVEKQAEAAREALAPEIPQPPPPQEKALTEAAVAKLERADEGVTVVTSSGKIAVKAGLDLLAGHGVETAAGGTAIVVYPDKTRIEVGAATELTELRSEGGKRLHLVRGELRAVVAPQRKNEPMIIATPHGEAKVLGTTLRLIVDPDPAKGTRLEVEKGKVELKDLAGRTVTVESGYFAVAAAGTELVSRLLVEKTVHYLKEEFKDGRSLEGRWVWLGESTPRLRPQLNVRGRAEFDLSPPAADGTWPAQSGGSLRSRLAFPLPFRMSLDVEVSHKMATILAGVSFMPLADEHKDAILLTLSNGMRGCAVEAGKGADPWFWNWRVLESLDAPGEWPRRERWTIELNGNDLRLLVNQQEVLRRQHDKRVHAGYYLRLEGTAMSGAVPQGGYVRFSNLTVEKFVPEPKK